MESTMENLTDMQSERVEQGTNMEIESGEQRQGGVKETENENPGETAGEEAPVKEQKDSPCPMVIEKGTTEVTSTLEKGTNDDDPPQIDDEKTHDEKNSQLETSPHPSPSLSVALETDEELIKPTVEGTAEQNIGSSEVSSDILKDDGDAVKVDQDNAVVHEEMAKIPDSKLSDEDTGSPHHADIVMEQEKAAEEHEMIASGDHDEFPVNPDNKHSEEKGSPHHHANLVTEQEKAAEEHEIISSGECKEFPANPDTKVVEENNDSMDKGEANNMNLAGDGSGPVNHDDETTRELDKGLELPGSETISKLENKPSEPLSETSMNVEKELDMPATENLTDNDKNANVLAVGVSGDSDKGLSVLPATQISSDNGEGMTTVDAEATEDMKLDVPDSKLVADATVDSSNNKNVNVEANTEKQDNSRVLVIDDTDNESAAVRREPGPPCVVYSNIKSEARGSGDLNNGVHKIVRTPSGVDGTMRAKRSFLLDDTSEGNESGTEEDQSAFMKELDSFFRERNMDFKPPKFYGEALNCLKLWRAVTRLGGYDKVTGSKLWRQVGESFRPPKTCTTVSWTFRGFYEKALLEYERHKVSGGELQIPLALELEPMNIDNQASGSGRARRDAAARAMQGWHSQRLNGNGEVSDPAIKDKNLVVHQKREKQIGTSPGLLKRKRPAEHGAKNTIQVSRPMLDVTVVDVGPPADWVKINVQRTQDCFEVYALVPGLVREEVRVQSDPAGRLVISGEPENPMNPWGATPFKKVVSLPTRIDPHHTSAVVTLNGQLFVRVPLEQLD